MVFQVTFRQVTLPKLATSISEISINGYKVPKHTVGITVINYIKTFIKGPTHYPNHGYFNWRHLQDTLLDIVHQYEIPYFWAATEDKPLWNPKDDEKYIDMKKNWISDDFLYTMC